MEDSSQASEFVDATQLINEDNYDQGSSQAQDSLVRSQGAKHFLQQSWANLAETDEAKIRQQEDALIARMDMEMDIDEQIQLENQALIDESGFKLVTNKSTKRKIHKSQPSKASSSYLTRSKVPNKPF